MEDEMTWSDVYAQRPVEYLEAVARGETPVWDSELKKFVYGDGDDTETIGGSQPKRTWLRKKLKTHSLIWKVDEGPSFLTNQNNRWGG